MVVEVWMNLFLLCGGKNSYVSIDILRVKYETESLYLFIYPFL